MALFWKVGRVLTRVVGSNRDQESRISLFFSNGYDSCYKNHVGFNKNGLKRSLVSDWVVLGSIGDGFAGFMGLSRVL